MSRKIRLVARRFGRQVARLRTEKEWSQSELADRASTTGATISNIETGKHVPKIDVAARLARALGVSLDELVGSRASRRGAHVASVRRPPGWPPGDAQEARAKIIEARRFLSSASCPEQLIGSRLEPVQWAVLGLLRHSKRPLYDANDQDANWVALCLEQADRFGQRWFFDELAAALRVGVGPDRRGRHVAASLRIERRLRRRRRDYAPQIDAVQKCARDAQRRLDRAARTRDRAVAARERLVATAQARQARKQFTDLMKTVHAPDGSDEDRRLVAQLMRDVSDRLSGSAGAHTPDG
jgi:transcriptional regulator with XRE-family HTH domain